MDDRYGQGPQPPKKPFQLDISLDDMDPFTDAHSVLEDAPKPKGEVYFSNPPKAAPPPPPPPREKKRRLSPVGILVVLSLSAALVL